MPYSNWTQTGWKNHFGKIYISKKIIEENRFDQLLYLNCDFLEIRQWITSSRFISGATDEFKLNKPIIFIDEVQRLENPGLLLKGIIDLNLPIKLIASGSSQLEIKSQVQEFLTGRHLEALILPLSYAEISEIQPKLIIYGCYPQVVLSKQKETILKQIFEAYISKDIVEILKIGKPDIMQKLITLLAHSSGKLINYNQLATDCQVTIKTIQNYCSILEKTYTICRIKPFVGNKRKEVVSNPIYYFIDNGFRDQALRLFSPLESRNDLGLLIKSAVFQEILKFREQNFLDFDIHYWRTQSGAEVDFVLYKNQYEFLPIEVKFRKMDRPNVTKSLRSFISAYEPKTAIIVSKNLKTEITIENTKTHFIPFDFLLKMFPIVETSLNLTT